MYLTIKALRKMMKIIEALDLSEEFGIQLLDHQGDKKMFVVSPTGRFQWDEVNEKWVLQGV